MRLHAALLIALTLSLPLPLAAADQDLSAGPATVKTLNSASGTCEQGSTGSEMHTAQVRVQLTTEESVFAEASSSCSSSAWSDGSGNFWNVASQSLGVYAGRQTDGNWGPVVGVTWWDQRQDSNWGTTHWCGSGVLVAGVVLALGCWPEGEAPPMLPVLP